MLCVSGVETPLQTLPYRVYEQEAASRRALSLTPSEATAGLVPTATVYVQREGDRGTVVWAIQRALNDVGAQIGEDGVYGPQTKAAVGDFQVSEGLSKDGIFGPSTSTALAVRLTRADPTPIPAGLLRGVVMGESNGYIGAVNTSTPGGTDCSYCQRRVYSADYGDVATVHRAFDGEYQIGLLARSIKSRHDAWYGQAGAKTHEQAWRLGTLNHNYPSGAQLIASVGVNNLSSYWTTPQTWVDAIQAKFPDGHPVRTPLDWCKHYSLSAPEHNDPGMMTRYVTDWSA